MVEDAHAHRHAGSDLVEDEALGGIRSIGFPVGAPASADGAMVLVDGPLAGAELFLLVELADDASEALVVGWSFVDG